MSPLWPQVQRDGGRQTHTQVCLHQEQQTPEAVDAEPRVMIRAELRNASQVCLSISYVEAKWEVQVNGHKA